MTRKTETEKRIDISRHKEIDRELQRGKKRRQERERERKNLCLRER